MEQKKNLYTFDDYKENPIFSYIESYYDLDQLPEDDINLIKDKLKLNKQGKIAIGGYLLFVV